jgi:hypothetical protein
MLRRFRQRAIDSVKDPMEGTDRILRDFDKGKGADEFLCIFVRDREEL